MLPHPGSDSVAQLQRFPLEVRDAYRCFCSTGDVAALHLVVLAVVRDYMPRPGEAALTDEMRLIEDLGYDSLAVAETVFFLEDLLQVRIENKELIQVRTVGELRGFVTRKVAQKRTAAA
ncbi:MAG TPA: acyl carrier protein [Opitutaceae bacterium]|jgi:acyl carrier protein|nr:acyl carrier protein [Opitutaceae bacterium]